MEKPKVLPAAAVAAGDEGRSSCVTLGTVLRRTRTERGMTRENLASLLMVTARTMQRMEDGDPSVALGYYLGACRLVGLPLLAVEVDQDLAARALSRPDTPRARRKRHDFFK